MLGYGDALDLTNQIALTLSDDRFYGIAEVPDAANTIIKLPNGSQLIQDTSLHHSPAVPHIPGVVNKELTLFKQVFPWDPT